MPVGAKRCTLQEERKFDLIGKGWNLLTADGLPSIHGLDIPGNYGTTKLLLRPECLSKAGEKTKMYTEQIYNMVYRKVARVFLETELREYKGPDHYIAHHSVLKSESKSTPMMIVFNSSGSYKRHALNEYWTKEPDVNNQFIAFLMQFRLERVALVGDIKKVHHSVGIFNLDQRCHQFLWRDMEGQVSRYLLCNKKFCVTIPSVLSEKRQI